MLGVKGVLEAVGQISDELFTSDEERERLRIQHRQIDADLATAQMAVNQVEAQHQNVFIAGWRPAIGWIGAAALGYQFLLYPFLLWFWSIGQAAAVIPVEVTPPPVLPGEALFTIVTGMLGIGSMRSFDKSRGVDTKRVLR